MDFDILIATRNRQDTLKLSLPLMLSQSRLPRRVIIVDSSDDHGLTGMIISEIAARGHTDIDFQLYETGAGTALQRNFGLKQVQSPIVMIPDDDAMWFPGVAEATLRIYERDEDGLIGAVGAEETHNSPLVRRGGGAGNRTARTFGSKRLRKRVDRTFNRIEQGLFPDPFFVEALERYRHRPAIPWLSDENAVLSATMTGFRMSFRSDLIRSMGFDEVLGRYALFEDHDACLSVLKTHVIARSRNARVFHRVSLNQRADPEELGAMHILNRAYITYKHSPQGSLARTVLRRFCIYKLLRYLAQTLTAYGRRRFLGALGAFSLIPELHGLTGRELQERYVALRGRCMPTLTWPGS